MHFIKAANHLQVPVSHACYEIIGFLKTEYHGIHSKILNFGGYYEQYFRLGDNVCFFGHSESFKIGNC